MALPGWFSYIMKKDHSLYCGKIVEEGWLFLELDIVAQDAVLSCPHSSHQAVQMIFRTISETEPSKDVQEGRLF